MGILIQGGRIVDAATDTDKKGDIYLEDGVITEIGEKLKIKDKSDRVIDAKGCLVMPGLIDLHVHFRDPGQTQKEDIETQIQKFNQKVITAFMELLVGREDFWSDVRKKL